MERLLRVLIYILWASMILNKAAAISSWESIDCQEKCGNISIPPPFGIKRGCYRSSDFRIICNDNTPRLFLNSNDEAATTFEITAFSLDPPQVYGHYHHVAFMNASTTVSSFSWRALENKPYALSMDNLFVAAGCDVMAYLVDLNSSTIVAACVATCKSKNDIISIESYSYSYIDCGGIYCCTAQFPYGLKSYEIRLERPNQTDTWNNTASWAFVGVAQEVVPINISASKDIAPVSSMLNWTINDRQTCEEARKHKDSYACGPNTHCIDNRTNLAGYICQCNGYHQGNPYDKRLGCRAIEIRVYPKPIEIRIYPKPNCPTRCGNVSVHFPFGIGNGCFRQIEFNLSCDHSAKHPILTLIGVQYTEEIKKVAQIELDEGKIKFFPEHYNGYGGRAPIFIDSSTIEEGHWVIENKTCAEAELKKDAYACHSSNSECYQATVPGNPDFGYRCRCLKGYKGNPYISNGCIDIDECITPLMYGCYGMCINIPGHYKCVCPPQTHGDPTKACYPNKKSFVLIGVIIGMSTALALLFLSISIYFLWKRWKERTLRKIKERHFRKNRGLFLQQLISSDRELAERTKIFSLEELEKATNHFDATRILGHGGHGTVYKGILSDQRVAAIKKAKIIHQKEIDEFINEVVILSQINHKNVVRLFGCCLESEVPLLVYEFVPNGTLSDHLERRSSLSWEYRLRIASEAAGALAYLHSSTSMSIFHRDVKSSNILLDDNYTAKVSDFGASRTLPLDQTHLTTIVQGTFGYLDPEYYQTCQLTEKSDVYSFGVILLELLTGEKPISFGKSPEEINLRSHFLLARREKRFFQLIEARVKEEGTQRELSTLTMLAEKCLRLRGEERPTMKDVEVILEGLRRSKGQKHHNTNEHHYELHDDLQNQSSNSCHQEHVEAFGPIDGRSRDSSRIFSQEREFISSLDWPR